MKKFALLAPLCLALTGCVEPLEQYRPVTDPNSKIAHRYESDRAACYQIAKQAEATYEKRQQEELGQNLAAGLLVGAVLGVALGDNSQSAAYGAALGATAGAAETDTELATGGPRRILDRCMIDRGHKIYSDLGKG